MTVKEKKKVKAPKVLEARFTFERDTKNKFVYTEVDDDGDAVEAKDALVGTLYVTKAHLGKEPPDAIRVTITPE